MGQPQQNMFLFYGFLEWSYWFQVVCAAVFTYLAMSDFREDRKKPLRIVGKLLCLVGLFAGFNFLLSVPALFFNPLVGVATWLCYILGALLYARLLCRYDAMARNVVAAVCFSSIILANEIASIFGILIEHAVSTEQLLFIRVTSLVPLAFTARVMLKFPVWKYYVSEPASFLSVFANTLSAIMVVVYDVVRVNLFGPEESDASLLLMIVGFSALYLINLVSYQMIYHLSREHSHVLELQAETQMDKSAASLLAVTENNLNELHKINHDIQNQYAYMRMLLRNQSYDALEKYFDELTGTFADPLVPFVDCGNRVLDLIFNMENAKAQEAGVKLDIKAAVPHVLPFRDLDLCNLYANLIDNAIEACIADQIPNASVTIAVSMRGDYLFTQIANPTKKDKSFLEKYTGTTKADRRLHGKGVNIVRSIVKRYNGRYAARIDNGVYYAEFMLDVTAGGAA